MLIGETVCGERRGVCGVCNMGTLYFLCNFSINLKLPIKNLIKKEIRQLSKAKERPEFKDKNVYQVSDKIAWL